MCSANAGSSLKQFSLEGNQFTLGCHFSSAGEAKIGILLRHLRKEQDSLHYADLFFDQALTSFGFVLNNLSSLNLSSSHRLLEESSKGQLPALEMDRERNNVGLADLKVNIQRLYDIVAIGIMDNRETAKEVKKLVDEVSYVSYQTSNHDARIDDNEMNLKEILGKIDRI